MNLKQAMKKLGENVKQKRLARHYTQDKMREKFGFNLRYYCKIEAGETNARIDTLLKLSKALNCSLSALLKM